MKTLIYIIILTLSTIFSLSCGREIPPVFEVYISFVDAENFNQINIDAYDLEYGTLNQITRLPSGSGTMSLNSGLKTISKSNYSQKVFITSVSQSIGMNDFLSINATLELFKDEKSFIVFIDKWNNIFPVNFNPEYGEAYEVHFVIDIKNSLVKNGNFYDFELGGDSKVVITKY